MAFYTLGIETSCDETAAAVLKDDRELLSNVVYSQAEIHAKHGGVVPEVASRDHVKKISLVVDEALQQATISTHQLDLIGATQGPGLVGCLLVGLSMAKGMAFGLNKPLIGVNHLEGHLFAHYLERGLDAPPPFVALIVSGGHTSLIHVPEWGRYETLGQTRDDAAGEAFDKVGKLIGLGYPAGVQIDRLSQSGDANAIDFPRPMMDRVNYDFSFAGLKTAVVYYLRDQTEPPLEDLAASFQQAVIEVLVKKTLAAARDKSVNRVVVVGGVAANSGLRTLFQSKSKEIDVHFPPIELCTDNGAMIAAAARYHFQNGRMGDSDSDFVISPQPSLAL